MAKHKKEAKEACVWGQKSGSCFEELDHMTGRKIFEFGLIMIGNDSMAIGGLENNSPQYCHFTL